MTVASHAADLLPDAARARRGERLLVYALGASVALHLAAVVVLPGFRTAAHEEAPPLEVRLVKPPPPPPPPERVKFEAPAPRAKPQPAPVAHKPASEPQPKLAPAPQAPTKPVLTLPENTTPTPPTFTVPAVPPAAVEAPAAAPAGPPRSAVAGPGKENATGTGTLINASCVTTPPPYPTLARRRGLEGTVDVQFVVGTDGRLFDVQVKKSSGSALLDSAAVDAARTWRCKPARRGQDLVDQELVVPVKFRLDNAS